MAAQIAPIRTFCFGFLLAIYTCFAMRQSMSSVIADFLEVKSPITFEVYMPCLISVTKAIVLQASAN
eukprot:7183421-Pyramimonas_sp.AAC.1